LNPEDFSYFSNRAICYYNIGEYQECIADCLACERLKPNFPKILRRKGMAYLELLKFDEAISAFKAAYQVDKDMTILHEL
jgi:tetratricopeptide (TPR) repeat protein